MQRHHLLESFGGKAISNLRYADDTALIENSKEALEHLTRNVNEVGKQLNLKLNVKKTKLMVAGSLKEEHTSQLMVKKLGKLRALSTWAQQRPLQQLAQEISNQE